MSQDVTSGQQTTRNWTDTQDYAWATGGAVEVYNLTSCDQYPINGVFYTDIALYDQNMTHLSPVWGSYIEPNIPPSISPSCNFNVTLTTTSENLYHNPTSVTASGGLISTSCGFVGCNDPGEITSITASGGNTITVTDLGGHTGTLTLSGATASGGLISTSCGFAGCNYPGQITSMTASGGNTITVTDLAGHTGTLTLSGATASGGLISTSCGFAGCNYPGEITSVTGRSNAIFLADLGGHNGYIRLE